MRARFAQREAALALVTLVAVVVALAVTATRSHPTKLPAPVGSYTALASAMGPSAIGRHTSCGQVIDANTEGVSHPVLPCGIRIYVTYGDNTVLTQVIDHGPMAAGRQFELTDGLAKRLGLTGVQTIRWSYAQAG